jgi:hypothetical protein
MSEFTITRRNGDVYRVLVDEEDYERVMAKGKWYVSPPSRCSSPYVLHSMGSIKLSLHRFLLEAPAGLFVDHINMDGLDCRKANLRLCTQGENLRNKHKYVNNTSGYKGVSLYKRLNRWRATISLARKHYNLGYFATPELAYEAYCQAAITLHGEFARTA